MLSVWSLLNFIIQAGKGNQSEIHNGFTARSSHFTILYIKQGLYAQKIEFFGSDIHLPMILGMPWISEEVITQVDWFNRIIQFYDGEAHHTLPG